MHWPQVLRRIAAAASIVALGSGFAWVGSASAAAPNVIVVGVDHTDFPNQDPPHGRLFEYTDFFPRSVTVHQGEVVDFLTAPFAFHIVGIEKSQAQARKVYPVVFNDIDDPNAPSGSPKIAFGPSNYPILHGTTSGSLAGADFTRPNGPPLCGRPDLHQADCAFSGPSDIEVAGPNQVSGPQGQPLPKPADWRVQINAAPGTYEFHCFIHPGMQGTLKVVPVSQPVTTQAQASAAADVQFAADRAEGLAAEHAANKVTWAGGAPGTRTYIFRMGVGTPDNHVAVDEIFPNQRTVPGGTPKIMRGDRIKYLWPDVHNVHVVFFPNTHNDVAPFGFDCNPGYLGAGPGVHPCIENGEPGPPGPELIADPGNAPPGTVLMPGRIDSGLRIGTAHGLVPQSQTWSLKTIASTPLRRYTFMCTVHDFMVDAVIVSG